MLPFFPIPYPDETLYSMLSRYHMYSGNLRFVHTVKDLFGEETIGINLDFISAINVLLERVRHDDLSAESLIYNHTVLPYFAAFTPEGRVEKAKTFMKENGGLSAHLPLGINGFGIKNNRHFRHCTECVREDMREFGEMYWHRIHQLPGVFICPKHERPLLQHNKMFKEMKSREFIQATDDILEQSKEVAVNPEHTEILTRIAKESQWLLNNRITITNFDFYSNRYLPILQNLEIATVSGKTKRKEWIDLFTSVYDKKLLALLQSALNKQKESNWIDQIVRTRENTFHPIRHLLIILLLSNNLEEFYSKRYKYAPFGDGPWPCLNYAHSHYREKTIKIVKIKETLGRPLGTFACDCGFIYARSGPDTNTNDIFKRSRIFQYGSVWKNKFEELLKRNISQTEMAKLLGVSRGTIKNKVAEMIAPVTDKNVLEECNKKVDEMRSRWIKLIERNPEKTLFQLSKINRKLHYWLYKNDYLWMKENTPTTIPKASVIRQYDWKETDEELLVEVQGIISEWDKYEYDKLRKISKFSIARKLISPHIVTKKSDKIPKTISFIKSHTETDEDFNIRKLNWAYKNLMNQEKNLNFSSLVKESKIGLRQLTPEVENYAKSLINKN